MSGSAATKRKGRANQRPAFLSRRKNDDQIDSLSSLEARNATFLEALILIASPVAGLRPMRGPRLRTTRMPSPFKRMRAPFLRCLVIKAITSSSIALALFCDSSCFSASWLASWRGGGVLAVGLLAGTVAMGVSLLTNQR